MPKLPRPTYGSVTATLALCAALGGTSYAAITVTGADVRNGSLTGKDIRDGSIRSKDVRNGSLKGGDVRNGSLTAAHVEDGSLTAADFGAGELPAGPAGPAGPQGPQGPGGFADVVVRTTALTVPADDVAEESALCDQGEFAVAGGAGIVGRDAPFVTLIVSEPQGPNKVPSATGDRPAAWHVLVRNTDTAEKDVTVSVLCGKG